MDFSEGVYGAVCLDFIYLFMSSATEEIKLTKFNELFKFYHQELSNALKSLQYDGAIPTLHQLYVQLAEKTFYGKYRLCKYLKKYVDNFNNFDLQRL